MGERVESKMLTPGTVMHHKSGRSVVLARRKDDDSGWWVEGGGGLADWVVDDEGNGWTAAHHAVAGIPVDQLRSLAEEVRADRKASGRENLLAEAVLDLLDENREMSDALEFVWANQCGCL